MTLKTVAICPASQKPARCEYVEDNVIHRCKAYLTITGTDAKTGDPQEQTQCLVEWLPTLLIEAARQQHHTAAAVESFRNETVQANSLTNFILQSAAQTRLTNLEDR